MPEERIQEFASEVYSWIQAQYNGHACDVLEGFAEAQNNQYTSATVVGENVLQFMLHYSRLSELDFFKSTFKIPLSDEQLPEFYEALGRYILAQLSVFRAQPPLYIR